MRELAEFFKALSDETRLQMIGLLLLRGELCVCDFERVMSITQSKASRHLRYLLNAGLLKDRRSAVWVHYRISEDLVPDLRIILEAIRPLLCGSRLQELEQSLSEWLKHKEMDGVPDQKNCKEQKDLCCEGRT
jgi:ArsR family transcriptional regulator